MTPYAKVGAPATGATEQAAILLIDDDAAVLESLAMVLECHGFHVLTARDGDQGIKVFREKSPSVVVTDIMMPEKDGIGTMLQMRREQPGAKIVVISGSTPSECWDCLRIARHLGADAAFQKTVDSEALIGKLRTLLRPAKTYAGC